MAHHLQLSPDATQWVGESGDDDHLILMASTAPNSTSRVVASQYIQPHFLVDHSLVAISTLEPRIVKWLAPVSEGGPWSTWALPAFANALVTGGHAWVAWMPTIKQHAYWDGLALHLLDTADPVGLTPNGDLWYPPPGCILPAQSGLWRAAVDHTVKPPRVWSDAWAPWLPTTHYAIPVSCNGLAWIVRYEDDRLVCHPHGDLFGHIIHVGDTFNPTAAWDHARQRLVVAWTDGRGDTVIAQVDLTFPRVSLRPVVPPPPPPTPTPPPTEEPDMDYRAFTWDYCTIHRDAEDIGAWPITAQPLDVKAVNGLVRFNHTKAGRWPEEAYADIKVEGCIWTIAPNAAFGNWRAATWDRLRPGQVEKTMTSDHYQLPYALDLAGWVPQTGDIVGYFVSTPARYEERGALRERSAIAWIRYGTSEIVAVEGAPAPPGPVDPTPPPTSGHTLLSVNARLEAVESWIWTGVPKPR